MENVEKEKIITGKLSNVVNVYHSEYTDIIKAYLKKIDKEDFENLTYYEIETIVYNFTKYFISGVETTIFYEDNTCLKLVYLNFYFGENSPHKSATIAYSQDSLFNTNNYKFIT